jgi:hypothetical protein
VIQIPKRVVDRRGREQQDIAPLAGEQSPQRRRPRGRVGIAVVVCLVHHDERVIVQRVSEVRLLASQLNVVGQLLVRHALDSAIEGEVMEEAVPGGVAKARGAHEEHSLATLAVVLDDLAGREGLSEPDTVGNHHPAVLVQDLAGTPDAVLLEGRDRKPAGFPLFLLQLVVVQVPEHLEVDEVGGNLREDLLVDGGQIEGDRVLP